MVVVDVCFLFFFVSLLLACAVSSLTRKHTLPETRARARVNMWSDWHEARMYGMYGSARALRTLSVGHVC